MKQNRNGKIEFLRFVFAMSILAIHINKDVWDKKKMIGAFSFFLHGDIGVEFFFVLTGCLMAFSLTRQNRRDPLLSNEQLKDNSITFMWKKIKSILPYHVVCCAIMVLFYVFVTHSPFYPFILKKIPSFFFLQSLGISGGYEDAFLGVEWYLSSMFVALAILYPLCRKYKDFFMFYLAPVIALILLGFVCSKLGALKVGSYHRNLRAFAEISLGFVSYAMAVRLQTNKPSFSKRILLTIVEYAIYLGTLLYACTDWDGTGKVICLLFLVVAVGISFSEQSVLDRTLFQNNLCIFLGAISMPIYIIQSVTRRLVVYYCRNHYPGMDNKYVALLILISTLLTSIVFYLLVQFAQNKGKKVTTPA